MTELKYLTAVSAFPHFGPARTRLLLSYFGSAKNIWTAGLSDLTAIGLSQSRANEFLEFRSNFDIEIYFDRLNKLGIKVKSIFDNDYPLNLVGLSDSPPVLYIRGVLKKTDVNSVAIVGTRNMTSYGKSVASKFAIELSNFGVTIVSGLALGIDAEAQRSAIRVGGRTIAVLASGLDIISPISNKELAMEFIKNNGALVSENPLGHQPFRSDFAVRNRLISGMSKAVLVVEGRMKSGTFYTVNAALAQGRPVFAVPGPITSQASEGPNYLIQNGAKAVVSVRDIVEELDLQVRVDTRKVQKIMPDNNQEKEIIEILDTEPLHLDEVVRMSGGIISEVSARLTIMEMKGMVKSLGGGVYRKV